MAFVSPDDGRPRISVTGAVASGGPEWFYLTVVRVIPRWVIALIIIVATHAFPSAAQGTLYTIMTNGPATNRLNIVIFSEGYTTNELPGLFLSDATNAVADLLAYEPYQEYQSYCNFYAISVPSKTSGSTRLAQNGNVFVKNMTYFNSTYDKSSDFIITIPPYNMDTSSADGMGKVAALLQSLLPNIKTNSVMPILLVNEPQADGGSGGPICISSTSFLEPFLIVHESGHTLAPLGDEYSQGHPDVNLNTSLQANTTATTNLQSIKWKAWIHAGTPIPTEQSDFRYFGSIGLFQGANYTTSDYRPAYSCVMNDPLSDPFGNPPPFCPVCCESMVESIYKRVRPVDAFSPATNAVISITNPAPVTFGVVPSQPATHSLTVQWYTNGIAIANATNATYTFVPLNFANGAFTLQAQVHDPTPYVLAANDPTNLLGASITWNVNIGVRILTIDSEQWLPSGGFAFRLTGRAANGFVIQSSANLVTWLPLSTNNLTSGQFYYTNNGQAGNSAKFYRALIR